MSTPDPDFSGDAHADFMRLCAKYNELKEEIVSQANGYAATIADMTEQLKEAHEALLGLLPTEISGRIVTQGRKENQFAARLLVEAGLIRELQPETYEIVEN